MTHPPAPEIDPVTEILRKEKRYPREAYEFLEESLRLVTVRMGHRGHVSAVDLLESFRRHALAQFGPLARPVLETWNVRTTDDIGRIVYLLVGAGALGTTDDDDEAEFHSVFDFDDAFPGVPDAITLPPRSDDDDE